MASKPPSTEAVTPQVESKSEILGPPIGYTDLLDLAIHEHLEAEAANPPQYFPLRPSSLGKCGRALAYELMEFMGFAKYEKELKDPAVFRLLELGHSVEFSVLKNFRMLPEFKQRYKQQVVELFTLFGGKAYNDKIVEGSVDAVLVSEKHRCVMDVKSFKDGWSQAYRSRLDETLARFKEMKSLVALSDTAFYAPDLRALLNELGDDFLVDNLVQLNGYACTKFLKDRGIDHGVIYKYSKNDSRHYELRFKPSQEVFEVGRKKFQDVYNNVAGRKKPEAVQQDSVLGSLRCAFCPFQSQCWDTDAKKAWYRTLPAKNWPKDTAKAKNGNDIEQAFASYEAALSDAETLEAAEMAAIKTLADAKITKVRLASGHVYELKYLKSPRPHFELRRSKA